MAAVTLMRPAEGVVATASLPGREGLLEPPASVHFTVPAHLSLLATIRVGVGAIVQEVGGSSACVRDLQLATDEATAVLIEDSTPWTDVELEIVHDDADVYIRAVSRRAQPGRPLAIHHLTQMLLDGLIESYELFADSDHGYAFLQTPRDTTGPTG